MKTKEQKQTGLKIKRSAKKIIFSGFELKFYFLLLQDYQKVMKNGGKLTLIRVVLCKTQEMRNMKMNSL